MMKPLRSSVSGWVTKLLLFFVVIAFVITGFSEFFIGSAPNTVVSAGGTDVVAQDYRLAYRQAEVELANRMQRQPSREEAVADGIDRRVMSQLVAGAVLDEQGREANLGLSEERLRTIIFEDPTFHDQSGRFSRNVFANTLSNVGMTENDFIRNREQAAIRSQIVEAVSQGASAPDTMKQAFGLYNGERRTVEFVTLPATSAGPVADPADDVLQAYFAENSGTYRASEYRGISYATLTAAAISDPATVTDEAIAADFERNAQQFTTPERRRIEQIVYPDVEAAQAAKTAINGGKLFEQAIIESGRTVADTQLGTLARTQIPDTAIADAAFGLAPNTVSGVVEGTFGPVLLRVTEIQPEVVRPLDEVREEIRAELALSKAADGVQQAYDTFEDARAGGALIDEASLRAGLTVQKIPDVSLTGETPDGTVLADLPAQQELLTGAFGSDVGLENPPIGLPENGYVFYEVTKVDPARDRTLDEVRDRVVADWKAAEAQRLLSERTEALKARVDAGESLDEIAASEQLTKDVAASVTRITGTAQLGAAGVRAAFSGPQDLVTTAVSGDGTSRLLMKVAQVAPPADPLSSLPAADQEQLAGMIEQDFLQSYITLLQNDYEVVQYPAAIQAMQALPQ